jgi:hypothetical protein
MNKIDRCNSRRFLNPDYKFNTLKAQRKSFSWSQSMKVSGEVIGTSSTDIAARISRANQRRNSKARLNWQQLRRSLIALFTANSEPQIRKTNEGWRVFDPISNQTIYFSTEQEVRIWLEQRYSL